MILPLTPIAEAWGENDIMNIKSPQKCDLIQNNCNNTDNNNTYATVQDTTGTPPDRINVTITDTRLIQKLYDRSVTEQTNIVIVALNNYFKKATNIIDDKIEYFRNSTTTTTPNGSSSSSDNDSFKLIMLCILILIFVDKIMNVWNAT